MNMDGILLRLAASGPPIAHLPNQTDASAPIGVTARDVATQLIGHVYLLELEHRGNHVPSLTSGGHTYCTTLPEALHPNRSTGDVYAEQGRVLAEQLPYSEPA